MTPEQHFEKFRKSRSEADFTPIFNLIQAECRKVRRWMVDDVHLPEHVADSVAMKLFENPDYFQGESLLALIRRMVKNGFCDARRLAARRARAMRGIRWHVAPEPIEDRFREVWETLTLDEARALGELLDYDCNFAALAKASGVKYHQLYYKYERLFERVRSK